MSQPTTLTASDGFQLEATVFEASQPRAVVVIASAMGVPRRIYEGFATYLAKEGLAVITFDYRGVGASRPKSLRGFDATLIDWATKDIPAALDFAASRWPTLPVLYVGHSVGGQLLGIVPNRERIVAALLVAAQSGSASNWDGVQRMLMYANWWLAIPTLTTLFGYLPMGRLAGGEDIPLGVARDWARWGRSPRYIMSSELAQTSRGFQTFDKPLRAYAFTDDGYSPVRSVQALVDFYEGAQSELRVVSPKDWQQPKIGHFGCFRRHNEATFYREALAFLSGYANESAPAARVRD